MLSKLPNYLALTATLSFSLTPPAVAQQTKRDPLLFERLEEMTDVLADMAETTAVAADLPGVVLDAVGNDAEALVNYVGGSIGYVPYTGVLRGADGTLRSGYGNSYDQSLALITLLRRAGFDAQILVGPETTGGAFSTERAEFPVADTTEDINELTEELETFIVQLAADGLIDAPQTPQSAEPLQVDRETANRAADAAVTLLGLTDFTTPPENVELYALVRYRATAAAPWSYADPAKDALLSDLNTDLYAKLNDTVPADHLHMTKVSIIIESETFGSVSVATLEAPTSNLADTPISFGFAPTGQAFDAEGLDLFDENQDLVLISDILEQQYISLEGQSISAEVAASPFASVFQTGAGLLGDAAASLAAEDSVEAPLLEKVKLVITTSNATLSDVSQVERTLVDRAAIDAAMMRFEGLSHRQAILMSLTGTTVLYSGATAPTPMQQAHDTITHILEMLSAITASGTDYEKISEASSNMIEAAVLRELSSFLKDTPETAHSSASLVLLKQASLPGQPNVIPSFVTQTDILLDGRTSGSAEQAFVSAILAAELESETVKRIASAFNEQTVVSSSFDVLQNSITAETAPIDPTIGLDQTLNLTERQTEFLAGELSQGKQIALWTGMSSAEAVWLEYDPQRGSARLASANGEGNATENIIMHVVAASLMVAVAVQAKCTFIDGRTAGECVACGVSTAAAGIGGGAGATAAGLGPVGMIYLMAAISLVSVFAC